jgi:predicted dehydrogenase
VVFASGGSPVPRQIRLMTLCPGHFHAALVHKQMVPGVHPRVYVYAPLDADLLAHLARFIEFNSRPASPTAWELDVRAGGDYLGRFLQEQPGNTVVVAGRNRPKIDLILAALSNGLHVLADKPWVIDPADFPKLEVAFRQADLRDLVAWDMMTERYEVTTVLQRELMRDPDVFGAPLSGTPDDPGLALESVHYLKKSVAGLPLTRPAWWFDPAEAGPALADVGTHLADLAMWLLFPDRPIDHRRDAEVIDAAAWPTPLDREQFAAVTGLPDFPPGLPNVAGDRLLYAGNGTATVRLRGVHVRLTALWDYEAQPGCGDTHEAVARGTVGRVEVRPDGGQPQLSVVAADPARHAEVLAAVDRRCQGWQGTFPGVAARDLGGRVHVEVPDHLRVGHEAHFASVVREFVRHFHNPRQVPAWEGTNLLTKYYLTTRATELARAKQGRP